MIALIRMETLGVRVCSAIKGITALGKLVLTLAALM